MAMGDGLEFTFDGPQDARTYLTEVGRLWAAWVLGMAALFLTSALALLLAGAAVIAALVALARPLQRRAEVIVPDSSSESGEGVRAGRTDRDRALRALAYGETPLRTAVTLAGASAGWLVARRVVVVLTFVGVVGVVIQVSG